LPKPVRNVLGFNLGLSCLLQAGKERKGKERKGKERKGKERKGKERKGGGRGGEEEGRGGKGRGRRGEERRGGERKKDREKWIFDLSQGQRENWGTPSFILSGSYRRSSLPSLYSLCLVHQPVHVSIHVCFCFVV
jgi:hypothetical protein